MPVGPGGGSQKTERSARGSEFRTSDIGNLETLTRQEYKELTDEQLVSRFRDGDADRAFTAIVERYQRKIYMSAKRLLNGDHDEADEIAQDTFVKAYAALANFRSESQLYTWLYRIMMNGVIQRSRKKKVREMVGLETIGSTKASDEMGPDDRIEARETTRFIEEAIERLPAKQKQVFVMRFYDELPYEEIAEMVGTSVGGLKANYFHAVKKIGEYLHQQAKISPQVAAYLSSRES